MKDILNIEAASAEKRVDMVVGHMADVPETGKIIVLSDCQSIANDYFKHADTDRLRKTQKFMSVSVTDDVASGLMASLRSVPVAVIVDCEKPVGSDVCQAAAEAAATNHLVVLARASSKGAD